MAKIAIISMGHSLLAIEYLSAALKKANHEVKVIFDPMLFHDQKTILKKILSYKKEIADQVIKSKPDLVAFSVITDYHQHALNLAREIKKKNDVPILFGGIHPTSIPEKVIEENSVDIIGIGECDQAIIELANSINNGKYNTKIDNFWFKEKGKIIKNKIKPLIENLDQLPFPDHEIFFSFSSGFRYGYSTITSRGCPFDCTYCCNNVLRQVYDQKYYFRRRSVKNVIEELIIARKKYNPKFIRFFDEIFTLNKKWLIEFSKEYKKKVNLPFYCLVHASTINEEIVSLLKEAGCYEVQMGVQTYTEKLAKEVFKRSVPLNKVKEAIHLFRKYEIFLAVDNIFGFPGQTEDELKKLAEFYAYNLPNRIHICYMRYYPKLEINKIALEKKVLTKERIEELEYGKNSRTMLTGGDSFCKELAQFEILFYLFRFLPVKVRLFLIKKEIYHNFMNWSPTMSRFFLRLFNVSKYDNLTGFIYRIYPKYILKKLFNFQ